MWDRIIKEEQEKEYFIELLEFLTLRSFSNVIFPSKSDWFRALDLTPFEGVKVVIIGQDPYHGLNQADGLAFSTKSLKCPPSLRNILKELESDLAIKKSTYDLSGWAKEGVLLLNSVLTVEKSLPNSHKNIGWDIFIERIFQELYKKPHLVYILWGKAAQKYSDRVHPNSLVISSSHPSPFSARVSFFGSCPFSRTNQYLTSKNQTPINWSK